MGSSQSPASPTQAPNPTACTIGTAPTCQQCPADFVITAPDRILKVNGTPVTITAADLPGASGGTFAWTTASAKISLSNANTPTVTVQGLAQVSTGRDAEVISVTRTQAGCPPVTKSVSVTVAAVKFSKANNQRYGYDDFDTPADTSDDHVSVKKSDHTFVHVDITGGAVGTDFDFACDDAAACAPVAPGGAASFDLRLNAGNEDKKETTLRAKIKSASAEVYTSIVVNVYAEHQVAVVVAKVHDSHNAATALHNAALDPAAHTGTVNNSAKEAVVLFEITNYAAGGAASDVRYDLDNNDALSYDINAGGGPEVQAISAAMTGTGTKVRVAIVRALRSYYYLDTAAAIGAVTLSCRGASVFDFAPFTHVRLGLGPHSEMVDVTGNAGKTLTLAAGVTRAWPIGTPIEFIASGWSSDPIIITEENPVDNSVMAQNSVLWTIAHEAGHRPAMGSLADVRDSASIMYFTQGWTDYRLRYCPRTHNYDGGTDNQWEMIPRP
jgi:hypothetical protein